MFKELKDKIQNFGKKLKTLKNQVTISVLKNTVIKNSH